MSDALIGLISIGGILFLIQIGMPIAIALMAASFVGTWLILGSPEIAGNLVVMAAAGSISSYTYGVVPLFMLMGLLISVSGVGKDTFTVASQIFRRLRGGVGMATVAANAVFAAVTGTSIASAAIFSRIAVPEMMRLGYTPSFSVGVVAGSSVLGMLIPPSLLMIVFGVIAEVSIGDLFTAGIIPGLVLALSYVLLIMGMVRFRPSFIGDLPSQPIRTQGEILLSKRELLAKLLPIVVLIALILGGIYGGFFTPTEAGAAGALGALLIALLKRRLTPAKFWQVLTEAGHVTAAISILLIGAHMYSRMLAVSGLPSEVANWVLSSGLGINSILILYLIAIILLGTILDAVAILLILVPLVLPSLEAQGVNLIWFGLMTIIAVETGLLTPPLGLSCFVVKANVDHPDVTIGTVFAGALPFAVTMTAVLAIIFVWPWLTTMLL